MEVSEFFAGGAGTEMGRSLGHATERGGGTIKGFGDRVGEAAGHAGNILRPAPCLSNG
jgi:hypothetical protein